MKIRRFSNKASLLIVASWMLVLIGLMIAGLAYRQNLEAKMMRYEINSLKADWEVMGVVNGIRYLIEHDPEAALDYPQKEIFQLEKLSEKLEWVKSLNVKITDEDSKINLNTASPEILKELFELLKEKEHLSGNTRQMVENILQWRGAQGGIRADDSKKGEIKSKPFESVEELLLINDIDYDDYTILKNYLTVYNMQSSSMNIKINLNTAPELVLKAIIDSFGGVDSNDKEALLRGIVEYRTHKIDEKKMERNYFSDTDLDPYRMIELLKLSPTITMVGLLTQLRSILSVDSQAFHISLEMPMGLQSKRHYEIILGPNMGSNLTVDNAIALQTQNNGTFQMTNFNLTQNSTPQGFPVVPGALPQTQNTSGVQATSGNDQGSAEILHWYEN